MVVFSLVTHSIITMVFTCQAICVDWPLSHAPISVLILTLRMVLCTDWAGVLYLGAQDQQGNEDRWPVRHFGTISRLFDLVAIVKTIPLYVMVPYGL